MSIPIYTIQRFFYALEEGNHMKHTDLSSALKTHEVMHLAKLSLQNNREITVVELNT